MTHSEDIKRNMQDYLNARIEALETKAEELQKKVEFLEAIIEVNNLNKEQ
jgi:hypothetical protein